MRISDWSSDVCSSDLLIGDTAYGTAEMLGWMVDEKSIEPHVPVWDKAERKDGTLSRSDFQWNAEADEYRCPTDKPLRSTGKATSADTLIYRSRVYDCKGCELKSLCCPNTTHRKIARQVNEAARDVARQIAATPRYQQSRKDRKKVEDRVGKEWISTGRSRGPQEHSQQK